MNIELFREYCLMKKVTSESFPFGEDILVFKVAGKMFALISLSGSDRANLKCDPEKVISLREHYDCVKPGYHMNKKHWNTVYFTDEINDSLYFEWIDDSYNLVVTSLPNKVKMEYNL
ncbi:MAG: MmcQ/YjbR family DNA-binding protein [Bacteroidetes bacterium]|nr:MmcQ/YjbR family DNA-binding protein [Bacteroidota bacterium]